MLNAVNGTTVANGSSVLLIEIESAYEWNAHQQNTMTE